VSDPCGMAGGTTWSHHGGGGDAVFTNTSFARMGDLASKVLPYAPSGTVWTAGSKVEVGWAIRYNHGGGYQYRLCPRDAELTEECFQRTPLEFDRSRQALVWNNGTRYPLEGVFVDTGTTPAGSTWARNPVPRFCPGGGVGCQNFIAPCPSDCSGDPECPANMTARWTGIGTWQGDCSGDWTGGQIVDTLIVPEDLASGEFVLGWRWDAEETTQIWQSCSDITICRSGETCNVPPPFTPPLSI